MSEQATGSASRWAQGALNAFRIFVVIHAATIVVQAVTAGQFMDGATAMRDAHGMGSLVVHIAALLQLVAAILLWRPGRGPLWPAFVSLLALLAGGVQSAAGGNGIRSVHVPLAVLLSALTIWLVVWAFQTRLGRGDDELATPEPLASTR